MYLYVMLVIVCPLLVTFGELLVKKTEPRKNPAKVTRSNFHLKFKSFQFANQVRPGLVFVSLPVGGDEVLLPSRTKVDKFNK